MKPIIQKLGMLTAMLLTFISASAYDFEVDGIAYTITSFSDLTCSVAASDAAYEGEIAVPSDVVFNGKTLTVTSISNSAFKSSRVTSVQLPKTIVEIEAYAFDSCENLNTVVLNEGLQSIGDYAFNDCVNLSDIDFPNSLKVIGSSAFVNCKSLSQIVLPINITDLGASAFMNCEGVSKASLAYIAVLESNVFNGCLNLQEIEWSNMLMHIKDYAFANCGFTKFTIPNTVTTIGTNILMGNKNLQSFTIGNGIEEISSDPIDQCPNVKELIISDGNKKLTLDFSPEDYSRNEFENMYFSTRPGAYSNKKLEYIYVGRNLTSPGESPRYTLPPFHGNKNINSVTIGPNVSSLSGVKISNKYSQICFGWLEGCSNMEILTIRGLSEIPDHFVKDASSLKTVESSNTTLSIGEKAFYNCTSLETIKFGAALSIIKSNALENCNALTSIYCKSKTPPTYLSEFNKDIYLNCHLNIPFETEHLYKSASPWNNFWNMSESPECVSEFEVDELIYSVAGWNDAIVSGNTIADVRDIIIPTHVEYYGKDYNVVGIGENSFKGAPISGIVIPGYISNIFNDAFFGCSKLKSVTLEYSDNAIFIGHRSALQLSSQITPHPNPSTPDQASTGFRNGYYEGLFYGLPIEHLVINRNIELPKYYERTINYGSSSKYKIVFNDIIYFPPFYGLANLKSVEIGKNVSAVCKNQIKAVVDAVPTIVEYSNFGKSDNIEVVVSNNSIAPIGGIFTQNVYENATLFLPNGGKESYMADDYWKHFSLVVDSPFITTESMAFDADEIILGTNESKTIMPIISPADASIKKLKWSSSASSIVAVAEDGTISSNSQEGEAYISVTVCDGSGVSASIKVIVQENSDISDVLADNPFIVKVENGSILITGKAESDVVEIFNIQGQLITTSTNNIININAKGIYLVKIGSHCEKIIL